MHVTESGHIRTLKADSNGGKGGLVVSWQAVKVVLTVITLTATAVVGIFTAIRSADQRLIAEQMKATRELIAQVEIRGSEDRAAIRRTQDEIKVELKEIRSEIRHP